MPIRILFLCTACPFGTSGSGVRTLHVAKLLEKIGPVTLLAASSLDWSETQLAQTREAFNFAGLIKYREDPVQGLQERFRQVFDPRFLNSNGVIVTPEDRAKTQALIAAHDVVWIHTFKLANAFRQFHWPQSIIDVDDYPSRFHASAAAYSPWITPKLRRWRNAFAWRRRESVWAERFSVVTVCKESDRAHFGAGARVHVVPNGFALPADVPARRLETDAPRLGMIGDFTYLPNHNGLKWFLDHCWTEIRRQCPTAILRLIGKASDKIAANTPGVAGLGYVPDTGIEIATWSAMIVPTRLGGGSHLKVAEGLARRVPIVTTQHGTRGYEIQEGRHALVADEPADFATACVRVLRDPAVGAQLSAEGGELFQARYSWDSIGPAVESAVQACLARG